MGRKINSMGYKKGFGPYEKNKSETGAPDLGTEYMEKYGDRALTLTLEYYIVVLTSQKCQIFFGIEEKIGNIICSDDCAEAILGHSFRSLVKPSVKDGYKSKPGGKWVIPFRFCDESDLEILGAANHINPVNSYSVDLSQPGPPHRIFF